MSNYSFLNKNNYKVIIQIITNYINLEQYELARLLLTNLVNSNLLNVTDLLKNKRIKNNSIKKKLYILRKVLKYIRRYIKYGPSPLQIFSKEISSSHFLLKLVNDYNYFVDIIFLNFIKFENNYKIIFNKFKPICSDLHNENCKQANEEIYNKKGKYNPLAKFKFILKKKYISNKIKQKILFDIILSIIITHKEHYLKLSQNINFNFFSIDVLQYLRRLFYLYIKTRELFKKNKKIKIKNGENNNNNNCLLFYLLDYVIPYNKKQTKIKAEKKNEKKNVDFVKNIFSEKKYKINYNDNFFNKIDELTITNFKLIDETDGCTHLINFRNKKQNNKKNPDHISSKINLKKNMSETNNLNIIYIPTLYIINQKTIHNYITLYQEEISFFFEKNIILEIFIDLFYLCFYLPSLSVSLFKALFFNNKFLNFLLHLFMLSNRKYVNFVENKKQNGNSNLYEEKSQIEIKEINIQNKIYKPYLIFLEAYFNIIHIYITVLIEKLKKNNLVNYQNFIYLFKFNHLFINNIFLFSLCSTISFLYQNCQKNFTQISSKTKLNCLISNHDRQIIPIYRSEYDVVQTLLTKANGKVDEKANGKTKTSESFPHALKQFHLATNMLNRVYTFLVMLAFYYNYEDIEVLFYNSFFYQIGIEKNDCFKNYDNLYKNKDQIYMVELNGIILYLCINNLKVNKIIDLYINKLKNKTIHRNVSKNNKYITYKNKCILYEILISTNTFYSNHRNQIYNIFIYLFNYIDDIYCKIMNEQIVCYPIGIEKNEDLLFYINYSRIYNIPFLSYLFYICQKYLIQNNFEYLNQILNNFKDLKNLCILYCLENTNDVEIKLKCLNEIKICKHNKYLYNYIKDIKIKIHFTCVNYYFYKTHEHILKLFKTKKVTKNDIYKMLTNRSIPHFLNTFNILPYVNTSFIITLKKYIKKLSFYKKKNYMDLNMLSFYFSIKSAYGYLLGTAPLQDIKKNYKLIHYKECKVKCLFYFTIILLRFTEKRQIKALNFIKFVIFIYNKLKENNKKINKIKSLFFFNLRNLVFKIFENIYTRLIIFFTKFRIIKNVKNKKAMCNETYKNNYILFENKKQNDKVKNFGILLTYPSSKYDNKFILFKIKNHKKNIKFSFFNLLTKIENKIKDKEYIYSCFKKNERKHKLKKKKINILDKYIYDIIYNIPQEYIYKNIINQKDRNIDIFILYKYKKQLTMSTYTYNLILYLRFIQIFKKLYIKNIFSDSAFINNSFVSQILYTSKNIYYQKFVLFHLMSYYISKYKDNEINRYIFGNNYNIDFLLVYMFLGICVTHSYNVENGILLLKFAKTKVKKMKNNVKTRIKQQKKGQLILKFLLYFIKKLHILLEIKKNISKNKLETNRNYKNKHIYDKQVNTNLSTKKKEKKKKKKKNILLIKYLLLTSNSLKIQSKLIKKYFIDLYKKKNFLQDMFFFFSNLKKKKKVVLKIENSQIDKTNYSSFTKDTNIFMKNKTKYQYTSYKDMHIILEKYSTLLVQNIDEQKGNVLNYLLYFFFFSDILITYIYDSISKNKIDTNFVEHFSKNQKNKSNQKNIYHIKYQTKINYNLFHIFTIDIYTLVKYILFIVKSYANAKVLCSLFFIQYYKILVGNIQTLFSMDIDPPLYKENVDSQFGTIDLCPNIQSNRHIKYKLKSKNIYKNKKPIMECLTSDFLFLIENINTIKIIERNINLTIKKNKITNIQQLYKSYIEYIINKIENHEIKIFSKKCRSTRLKHSHTKSDTSNMNANKKNYIMNIFICLEKCDYYFPFCFNILYAYNFSRQYNILNRYIKELYNNINKIFKITKNAQKKNEKKNEKSNNFTIELFNDIYFIKYHDLFHFNYFTKSVFFSSLFDNQSYADCVDICEKGNQFYQSIIIKKYYSNLFQNSNKLNLDADKRKENLRFLFEYILQTDVPIDVQIDIFVNKIMRNYKNLEIFCFHELMLALNMCLYNEKVQNYDSKSNMHLYIVNCENIYNLPNNIDANIAKLNAYKHIFKIIYRIKKIHKLYLSPLNPTNKFNFVNIYISILKKGESKIDLLKFISTYKLFKYCDFLVNFKNFSNKDKSEILIKSTNDYILNLWGLNKEVGRIIESYNCKIMKKKKIILFLKKLKAQNFQNIINYIFYKNKPNILTNLLHFLLMHFKHTYIKKFYVLSLFAKYMKIEHILKKNFNKIYKNILPILIQNNHIELAEYIISKNLITYKIYKIYYYALLNINVNLNTINKSMVSKNKLNIKKNNFEQIQKENIYNIQKCIDILKLSTIYRNKNNIQFIYSIFLFITQKLFDQICESLHNNNENNIYSTSDYKLNKHNLIKLRTNHFENDKKDIIKYTQNIHFQKKHSLFNMFYKNYIYRNNENVQKHKQTKNNIIRKYYIIDRYAKKNTTNIYNSKNFNLEINNSPNNISNHDRQIKKKKKNRLNMATDKNMSKQASTNILIYIFYKICFFFYENYKELKSATNLISNLLPILIYIKISINLNIKIKDIIKMNIQNLINALKKQNYNICNYLIHRIYSCYFYNINAFYILNEYDLFYSFSKKKEISKKYRTIKNLMFLIYRFKLPFNNAENVSLTSLEKIKRFYIFNHEHMIYIYRNNNINKILYNNLMNIRNKNKYNKIKNIHNSFYFDTFNVYNFQNENKQIKTTIDKISDTKIANGHIFMNPVDEVKLCNIIKKTKNNFKVIRKGRIHKIIQNIRFNIIAFHYELLNKNNMHFYSTLSLFCFFFFDFHFCNNIYKNYKKLSSYFNKYTHVERNNVTNNLNIKQVEIFKEIKNQERNYRKNIYSDNLSLYKNNNLINNENIYKMIIQTGKYSYLIYIILTNSEINKIKKERKKTNIRQNIFKYFTIDNINYYSCLQIKKSKELFSSPKYKSKNNIICTNLLYNEQKYIYSFSTPIYISRHVLNEITFSFLYNYYNNIYFKAKDSNIEKVNKFAHKNLFIYLIDIIKNPYVINYNEHYFENEENYSYNQDSALIQTLYLRNYCLSILKKKNKINNNNRSNFMNKSEKKDKFLQQKNNKLKIKKLASSKTTFIYSNYIRQKKITQITNMFKNKLEIFQRYIILMHNNSLDKNIMQFFISKDVIDYYEYLFYDINNCSYPLCYINPSANMNIMLQYFKNDINQVSKDIYFENTKYVNNKINAKKIKIYLFITSLLLPLESRSLKLTNYNNSKYDDNFIRSLKDYCSLHNLMNLYTKYDLSKSCLKLLIKNNLLSEYFIGIVKRANKYNYIYKIFQNVSNFRNPLLQQKIKCYLLKKKMYNLLYNYVIFSSDYLNAAIISIYHYSIAQNVDAKNGHLNNALVNFTLIVKSLESSKNYKNSNRNIFYDNFIFRNNTNRKKKNRQLYNKSNFNILFDETKKRTNHTIPIELIFRYIDLIILQQQLLQEDLDIHGNIINSKKIDIMFCINLLIYKNIYNLADKIINIYQFNYIFTYCLACMFCLLINQNLSFLKNIMNYIKIKLNNNDINIFVLHIIYLYLGYRRKFKFIYEAIQEMHEKEMEPKKTELNNSNPNISNTCAEKYDKINMTASQISEYDINMNILPEQINNILTYITDNDFLFYSHVLIYIHNKKEYKNLFKHIKNILFTNIKKNDIYKMIICAYKYISNKKKKNTNLSPINKKSNYNFIHDNLPYLKKKKINKISIKQFGNIHQDQNFSTLMSLAKQYPDNIKYKISTEILSIYKNCSTL
ncbi:conserved Plasmodium protein, unknown function [Plasmodium berghei]|uniref:Uncharacterized protein n=4 Tax=Plasmodium berghei TaxID=5821 RepID=A0A509AHW0_PLABA|nr:conserved Plasmodium protein, unknown function [Plasmodium berghei ANKA]CXI18304.1 conserved Plasmodium protein, unknown function [Plasmodium berghei]SCO59118.1 conserved Plasmodium protein, unknown function [Plasmodium berghei]VUC54806.1 conserved Plasmodium protein, unknown function [Plasmodium berghei ANKA]|eukprot:XP_034420631.1 conserved Plasmodium protein, unknown function [Plasmodium berghei ANKA]